ncbi:MAG TPA: hypothetical protein VGS20_07275 [Candidatus Acidoferrales bacterium]|nr:hypothetical protein [Candidatus Acidoferrales bacterium]
MVPTETCRTLYRRLDRKLSRTLQLATTLCLHRAQPVPVALEVFFCALFVRYRRGVLKFFEDEAALARLVVKHCPEGARKGPRPHLDGGGDAVFLAAEPELLLLLVKSAGLAGAMRDRSVSLRHIAGALALDAELAARLGREGISLAGRVLGLPSGPTGP